MRYFVEYEFKIDPSKIYWFPLCINAENATKAEVSAKVVQTAIEHRYRLIRRTRIQPIISGFNSEYITEYINRRLTGSLEILEFNLWRFKIYLPTLNSILTNILN